MSLTDVNLRALKAPHTGQRTYFDDTLSGFGCRVSQGGTKTFVLVYGADRRRVTIGRYPIISLAKAREEAKRILAEHTLGRSRPQAIAYERAVELFLEDKARARRPTTVYSYKVKLKRLRYKGALANFTHEEARTRLDRIKAPSERAHVMVAARAFFKWCHKRRYIDHYPLLGLTIPKSKRRKRILTDEELRAIWVATEEPSRFHTIIRLCILTGQRRGELAAIAPNMIGQNILVLPGEITKNHAEHALPLSAWARSVIDTFTYTGRPFNDWGRAKADLDKASGVTGWVIHDIRRTLRSRLPKLGVQPHISERLINHISAQTELERTYDLYEYLDEKRDALERWEKHLEQVLSGHVPDCRATAAVLRRALSSGAAEHDASCFSEAAE